jgi:hypothetical protein
LTVTRKWHSCRSTFGTKQNQLSFLPPQNVLSIVFLYQFLVCLNFLLMRMFPAHVHLESYRNSMTSSSFWTATSDCKSIPKSATGCYRILHQHFLAHFSLSVSRSEKSHRSQSGEIHHLLLLHHLHSHVVREQCGREEPSGGESCSHHISIYALNFTAR